MRTDSIIAQIGYKVNMLSLSTEVEATKKLPDWREINVEPQIRLELMTCRLQGGCSTN